MSTSRARTDEREVSRDCRIQGVSPPLAHRMAAETEFDVIGACRSVQRKASERMIVVEPDKGQREHETGGSRGLLGEGGVESVI